MRWGHRYGRRVTLTTDNGANFDNVFAPVTFDDSATTPVTDAPFVNNVSVGAVQPEGALAAFNDMDASGTWRMNVASDGDPDFHTWTTWSLEITTCATPARARFQNTEALAISAGAASTGTRAIGVSGFGSRAYVCGIEVRTDLAHTFAADIDMSLAAPDGTSVVLTTDNGGGNDNVFLGTLWSDQGPEAVTEATFANDVAKLSLTPEGALSRFHGLRPDGTWVLTVSDDTVGDGGSLNGWMLDIATCFPDAAPVVTPPPVTITVPGPRVEVPAPAVASRLTLRRTKTTVTGVLTPGAGRAVRVTVQRKVGKRFKLVRSMLLEPRANGAFVIPASAFARAPRKSTFRITASAAATTSSKAAKSKPFTFVR